MSDHKIKTGLFLNQFPFVSSEKGTRPLVVFPQIRDSFEDIRNSPWSIKLLRRLSKMDFCVHIIGRKRRLEKACTTLEMAADYQKILKNEIGPASIIGISLGGLIAQHFASDYPMLTQKLVLAVSGYKIDAKQHKNMRKWIDLAAQGKWKRLYLEIAYLMHSADKKEIDMWLSPMLTSLLKSHRPEPSDFITSMNASMSHDTTDKLNKIKANTLIIGGQHDILFPERILHKTAERIPLSRLYIITGTGHGAFDEKKREFDRTVLNFLKN